MADIAWYASRISKMQAREIPHRVLERLRVVRMRLDQDVVAEPFAPQFRESKDAVFGQFHFDNVALREDGELLLAGDWPALSKPWRFEDDGSWCRAPDTGREWQKGFFADINWRQGNETGDVRYVWEPARLQQLVALAKLSTLDEDAGQAIVLIERQLASFLAANPPYLGIHYASSMECALRIVAVSVCCDLCRDALSDLGWAHAALLIEQNARMVESRLSLYSSAGNHTVAEAVGLVFAGSLLKPCAKNRRRVARGRELLEAELPRQIHADGSGIEQASWYLRFLAELTELAQSCLRWLSGHGLEAASRLPAAWAHVRVCEKLGHYGDSDGAFALCRYWQPAGIAIAANEGDQPCRDQITGLSVLESKDVVARFDHGPLGMAPSFGHGHADALQVTVNVRGVPWLVDPGTFTYTGDPLMRRYFKGTAGHNTVRVADLDQTLYQGPFLWEQDPGAQRWASVSTGDWRLVLAGHRGFAGIGVTHWRAVAIRTDGVLVVVDGLEGAEAEAEMRWHFHPYVDLALSSSRLASRVHGVARDKCASIAEGETQSEPNRLGFVICGAERVDLLRASHDPLGGWYSSAYGVVEPTVTLSCRIAATGRRRIQSVFHPLDICREGVLRSALDHVQPLLNDALSARGLSPC